VNAQIHSYSIGPDINTGSRYLGTTRDAIWRFKQPLLELLQQLGVRDLCLCRGTSKQERRAQAGCEHACCLGIAQSQSTRQDPAAIRNFPGQDACKQQ
jgi:hypothetical protein